jgi:predicted ester cyclase
MSTEANKALIRRWVEEVLNNGDLTLIDEFVAPEMVNHAVVPELQQGSDNFKRVIRSLFVAFPDHHMELEDLGAEADKVWYRGTRSGTHQGPGPLPGLAPTGKFAAVQHIHLFRIANGKMVEHWALRDDLGFLQQIGVFLPAEARQS